MSTEIFCVSVTVNNQTKTFDRPIFHHERREQYGLISMNVDGKDLDADSIVVYARVFRSLPNDQESQFEGYTLTLLPKNWVPCHEPEKNVVS